MDQGLERAAPKIQSGNVFFVWESGSFLLGVSLVFVVFRRFLNGCCCAFWSCLVFFSGFLTDSEMFHAMLPGVLTCFLGEAWSSDRILIIAQSTQLLFFFFVFSGGGVDWYVFELLPGIEKEEKSWE